MTNRTPTGKSAAERRRERLASPDDSSHFDPAIAPDWTCSAEYRDEVSGQRFVCDRHDEHDRDPAAHGHYWRQVNDTTDQFGMVKDGRYVPVPDGAGLVPSPRDEAGPAGQSVASEPTPTRPERSTEMVTEAAAGRPLSLIRPDASEMVLGAAMGVINPVADPSYAITHAEEQARVLIIGQHWANMLQAVSPPASRLVDDDDVRAVYRKVRQIAATHGIDLDGEA